jgi:sterol carrier protein 2
MVKFAKPGASEEYNVMASKAARAALEDAGPVRRGRAGVRGLRLRRQHLRPARGVRGRAHGHPRLQREQQLLHRARPRSMLGARPSKAAWPSACSPSASSRWRRARSSAKWTDRTNPLDKHVGVMNDAQGVNQAPAAAQMFGGAGREYRWKLRHQARDLRQDLLKARSTPTATPTRSSSDTLSLEEIMAAPEVFDPLTRYQCCPPTCGAAAAVLCSDEFARSHGIEPRVHRGPGHDHRLPLELRGAR